MRRSHRVVRPPIVAGEPATVQRADEARVSRRDGRGHGQPRSPPSRCRTPKRLAGAAVAHDRAPRNLWLRSPRVPRSDCRCPVAVSTCAGQRGNDRARGLSSVFPGGARAPPGQSARNRHGLVAKIDSVARRWNVRRLSPGQRLGDRRRDRREPALALVYRVTVGQATTLAYRDAFKVLALASAAMIPVLFLTRRPRNTGTPAPQPVTERKGSSRRSESGWSRKLLDCADWHDRGWPGLDVGPPQREQAGEPFPIR